MKAIIPKNYNTCLEISRKSLEHSEETMKRTWADFSDALVRKNFEYTDTDSALAVTFLKQFDKWFQGIGKKEMETTLSDFLCDKYLGRGTIIKPSEPRGVPPYDRFMPVAKFITEDNRFSPAGVEWLYLAAGTTQEVIQKCAEKECRVKCDERFAFCNFQVNHIFCAPSFDKTIITLRKRYVYTRFGDFILLPAAAPMPVLWLALLCSYLRLHPAVNRHSLCLPE